MVIFAADAKEFSRTSISQMADPSSATGIINVEKSFYSALGCGVIIENGPVFKKAYCDIINDLAAKAGMDHTRGFYCSSEIKRKFDGKDYRKAVAFCDNLVSSMKDYVSSLFFSYAIFPPTKIATIRVGGDQCPSKDIPTAEYIRNFLPQMFPYITAWRYFSRHKHNDCLVHLDSFQSKMTPAWEELLTRAEPRIFPHGDECNPFISFADVVAFLTDYKLGKNHLRLEPENVKSIWGSFDVDVLFVDNHIQSKVKWTSEEKIDVYNHLNHPIVFIIPESPEMLLAEQGVVPPFQSVPKFSEMVKSSPVYDAAINLAQNIDGSVQFFDKHSDRDKIRDGDQLVYIGRKAEELATTYSHMYDIEMMSGKELRRKFKR